jgi:lysyl-tRNA synthetase class 2
METDLTDSIEKKQRLLADTIKLCRDYFLDSDALEVFPPTLVPNPGMEPHLRPFALHETDAPEFRNYFLHTSPEFAIKSDLHKVDGDVFAIVRAFRDEVTSQRHFGEFHLLEWYRRDADYRALMEDVESLMARVSGHFGIDDDAGYGHDGRFPRISYREACEEYVGIAADEESARVWEAALKQHRIEVDENEDLGFLESVAYGEVIEPALFDVGPCFIVDYPERHAALARRKPEDESVAERVEFYLPFRMANGEERGLELANGFSELLDADEQRQRFELDTKQLAGRERPMPNHVLEGISGLSETAGMALGVTRLAMWIGQQLHGESWSIRDFYFGVR